MGRKWELEVVVVSVVESPSVVVYNFEHSLSGVAVLMTYCVDGKASTSLLIPIRTGAA